MDELEKLKKSLEDKRSKNQENIAMQKVLMDQLKKDFNLHSLEEAEKYLKSKSKEIEKMEEEYDEMMDELREKMKELEDE